MDAETSERLAKLERRVEELEGLRQLDELLVRYAFAADLDRDSSWTDLWTEDGVFDVGSGSSSGASPPRVYKGQAELLQLISGPTMPPTDRSQHHIDGPRIFRIADDGTATGESYSVTLVKEEDGGNRIWNMGYRKWDFVRSADGGWKIRSCLRREVGHSDAGAIISMR